MLGELLKGLVLPMSRNLVDAVVDEATHKLDKNMELLMDKASRKADEMAIRVAHITKELVPPILFSAIFMGAGVLILVIGASTYIDSVVMMQGAGFMLGGLVLILLGGFYKMKMEKAFSKIKEL